MKIGRLRTKEEFFQVAKMYHEAVKEVYYFEEPADPVVLGKWLKEQLESPDFDLFVAIGGDGEVAGFGFGYVTQFEVLKNPVYFVEMVYVKPEYRRSNAAFLLMNALSKQSEKSGLTSISYLFADNRKKDGMPTIAKRFATEKKPFLVCFYREPARRGSWDARNEEEEKDEEVSDGRSGIE